MLTESLHDSYHPKGPHGYGGIWGGSYSSFHHNIIAHHTTRTPRFAGARDEANWNEHVDYRNNVIYNWASNSAYGGEPSDIDGAKAQINIVDNFYKSGPATADSKKYRILEPYEQEGAGYSYFYIDGNFVYGSEAVTNDNWTDGVQGVTEEEKTQMRKDTPFEYSMMTEHSAQEAFEYTLRNAGCLMPQRDDIDERIVNEISMGTATYGNGIIDSQDEVGGYPVIEDTPPPDDTDHDGMSDAWEIDNGLDPEDPSDGPIDSNNNGYTNLEEYLNELVEHTLVSNVEYIPQPVGLEATIDDEEPNVVHLMWDEYPENTAEMIVERSVDDRVSFEELALVATGSMYSDVTEFEESRAVFYRIKARTTELESLYSKIAGTNVDPPLVTALKVDQDHIRVFPNPTKNHLVIVNYDKNIQNIVVRNLLGNTIPLTIHNSDLSFEIVTENWRPGVYVIRINLLDRRSSTFKIVKL
jgi:hypothetical protein